VKTIDGAASGYVYDGAGLRVKTSSTLYIFAGAKVIAEYPVGSTTPATPTKEYVYSGGQLLATFAGTAVKYSYPDHLSTRVEADSTGAVLRKAGHLPFGDAWYETLTNGGVTSKWKFTSYERDTASDTDYAIFRNSSWRYGRFMQADKLAGSIGDPQSFNRYAYTRNDPVNLVDPLGLDWAGIAFQAYQYFFGSTVFVTGTVDPVGGSGGGQFVIRPLLSGDGSGLLDGNRLGVGQQQPPAATANGDCAAALQVARKNQQAINRAMQNWAILVQAGNAHGVDPRMLAAIGVRETGFRNINEVDGAGVGMGVFQLTVSPQSGVPAAQAQNLSAAANSAAALLASNMENLSNRFPSFTPSQLQQATAASYNFGAGNISGNPNTIDVGSAHNNYGSNILQLMDCFPIP
jgi:RHS repeat-associated protein